MVHPPGTAVHLLTPMLAALCASNGGEGGTSILTVESNPLP
jgi:hypothetical protein